MADALTELPGVEKPALPKVQEVSPVGITAGQELPPVDHAAVTAAAPKPATAAQTPAGAAPVDFKGRTFNPAIHETDAAGKPIFCRERGRTHLIKCKNGRPPSRPAASTIPEAPAAPATPPPAAPPGAQAAPPPASSAPTPPAAGSVIPDDQPAPAAPPPPPGTPTPEEQEMEILAGAATLAGLQLMLMRAALGPDVGREKAQSEELTKSWLRVFRHYGFLALHPVLGLALVTGGIVVASSKHEETRSRLGRLTDWFKFKVYSMWQRWTGRRRAKPEMAKEPEKPKEPEKSEAKAAA